ncbi:MAG TPA: TIR domain-containing protein [Pyrinomonadaceae bacterium]|nr:TIR domain-containing protein [Pyrinomonadaceae bacterium]
MILRVGSLCGWIGSTRQIPGAQEIAKDLICEAIEYFESLQIPTKIAEAKADLAICYWREGALDEARIILHEAINQPGLIENDERARALMTSALVEKSAGRFYDALNLHTQTSPLVEASADNRLKGRFHNEVATVLAHLGRAELRADYIDRAYQEYTAASFYFQKAGNKREHARVENNLGRLYLESFDPKNAHLHLDRARTQFRKLGDLGGTAYVDENRAKAFIADFRYLEAERVADSVVRVLEQGDEIAMLAEALMTKGISQARLGESAKAQTTLLRSIKVFEQSGSSEGTGRAALAIVEELSETMSRQEVLHYFKRATDALARSQQVDILTRLLKCARRVFDSEFPSTTRSLKVFLCHSKADKPQVRELHDRLRAESFDPWLDEEKLLPGQEWEAEISKAVRSTDVVIVCLSKASTSKAGFVQKEISYALDVAEKQPEGTIFLIPLKLEDCPVPDRLSKWQWVDFFEISGFTRLINSLHKRALELTNQP